MERRIAIYLTNLHRYNCGILCGEWVKLPVAEDKLQEVLECESSMSIAEILELIDDLDSFDLLEDIDSDEALAEYYLGNGYIFCDVPDNIKMYLDLDRLGRDIRLEGNICYTSYGTVVSYR